MAVALLLLQGEGRRREPRRLAAEMPVALLLLEEGRRHEPRELAAPLVLLLLLRGGRRHEPRELAAEVRRLFCCCWERDDDAAPGGGASAWRSTPPSRRCLQARRSRTLPARPPVSTMPTPAHTAQCGCSRRLAAVVLLTAVGTVAVARGRRVSSERLPYGQ